jgi:SAM-dependent methyltransferase
MCVYRTAEAPRMNLLAARHPGRELLDAELLDPRELRVNLREMAMLNRLPGGVRTSMAAIRRLIGDGDGVAARGAVVLDVGTGLGDLPRRLLRYDGLDLRVVAIDVRREVLEIARRWLPEHPRLTLLRADARALPLSDESVDVAHASLLLHHLEPEEVAIALREMRRVARRGIIVNDLRRGALAFAVSAATVLALSRGRYTRHDGVLSARRAYTLDELDDLATSAGLHPIWRSPSWQPRVTTIYR